MTHQKRIIAITILAIAVFASAFVFIYHEMTSYTTSHDWAEGKVMAGVIGKMLGDYAKLKGKDGKYPPNWEELLEVNPELHSVRDLFNKNMVFQKDCFSWEATYDETLDPPIRFLITVEAPKENGNGLLSKCKKITFDQNNILKEYTD